MENIFKKSLIAAVMVIFFAQSITNAKSVRMIKKRQISGGCDRTIDMTPIAGTGCRKFWRCDGERLFEFECGGGTLFNPKNKLCDWPHHVKCDFGLPPPLPLIKSGPDYDDIEANLFSRIINKNETDSDAECDKLNLTSLSDDCAQYYLCMEGILTKQTCPTGTLFDNKLKNCNWESEVSCTTLSALAQKSSKDSSNENVSSEINSNALGEHAEPLKQILSTSSPSVEQPTTTFAICPQFETAETKQAFCSLKSFRDDYPNCCF